MQIDRHERRCLELAWAACAAGTIGVGAVLVDADDAVVAEGANGLFAPSPAGPLSGNPLAHAEMNVLAQLPAGAQHEDATLYTSLEPCVMCAGALVLATVGEIKVISPDPLMHDLDAMGARNDWVRARWAPRTFCTDIAARDLAALFAAHSFYFWFGRDHGVGAAWRTYDEELATRIEAVVGAGSLVSVAESDGDLDDVIASLGDW